MMVQLLRRWRVLSTLLVVVALLLPASVSLARQSGTPSTTTAIVPPAPGQSKTIDAIRKRGKLRAGVALAAPWLLQDPKTNQYIGPVVDITNEIAKSLGVEVEYVPSNWDVLIAGLQANKFDIAIAPMFASPQRMKVIDFVTYTEAGTCYIVKKDNNKVNSLEDLNSKDVTIITYTGTGTEEGIKKKYPKATVRSIVQPPGAQVPLEEVLSGRVDVGPFDSPVAKYVAEKYPQLKVVPGGPDYCVAHPDIPYPIGMGFNKGDPKLTEFLQAVVNSMQAQINAGIAKYTDPKYMAPSS